MRIGITLGDPCGIGPEVVVGALRGQPVATRAWEGVELFVFGDAGVLGRAGGLPDTVALRAVTALAPGHASPGRPTPEAGRAQVAYLDAAVAAVRRGEIDALVTAPISKRAAHDAGFAFPGHTEFLAHALGAPMRPVMMLAGPRLRVTLCTTHVALRDVPSRLETAAIADTIVATARALAREFGLVRPRVAVAGLNPHSGEGGAFGDEETRVIAPAVALARESLSPEGLADVPSGPHVPDVVFRRALDGEFDAVVCMYHDQGLIPIKALDFDEAVNVTLGLPIVRTSPDHGTAYDIAGRGLARPTSMLRALELCVELATRRLSC
jgi:4-hydroxythreonine-4-phosphate dehydrogenase